METQHSDEQDIISSGVQRGTVRSDGLVVPSDSQIPLIIDSSVDKEVILNEKKYQVIQQITQSGEAEIYLVESDNQKYIFKYYYPQYKPKDEILNKLKGLKHPDIIALIDYGEYHGRFFEITEYAQGGTLEEIKPITSMQKVEEIVKEIIEALNFCHCNGIIHRDIKPGNIFYRSLDKTDIAIGDFGIASNLRKGEELVKTTLARTNIFAAPELFTSIRGKTTIEKSVDYYALGMTLLYLWFGKDPFEDVDEFGIMRLKTEGRVLFPDSIDLSVERLIKGLITVNPRERWGYEEVKKWLEGEDVRIHYQTLQIEYKPYSFGLIDGEQIIVNNPKDLASYLEKYREKGEGHIYRNTVAKWVESVDQGLYNELMDIVEKDYPLERTAGITKAIYILDKERAFRGFDKTILRTQEEIAEFFEKNFTHYINDLQDPNASFYLFLEAREYKDKADEYRNYFKITNPETALNTIIFKLQGGDKFILEDKIIYQSNELLDLEDKLKKIAVSQLANTNSKLSLWISSFTNLRPTIDKWRVLQRYDNITFRYALNQGFDLNGNIVFTKWEFQSLFKDYIPYFFSDDNFNSHQDKADHWLSNYQDQSFFSIVLNYLKSEDYSDQDFQKMLSYVCNKYSGNGLGLYATLESLLRQIQIKTNENLPLFQFVVQLLKESTEKYWENRIKTESHQLRFIDLLDEYITFTEKQILVMKNPAIIKQLTYQLNDRIALFIRKDTENLRGRHGLLPNFVTTLEDLVRRIKNISHDLPYIKRYQNELILMKERELKINEENGSEKKVKISLLKQKLDKEIIDRKKYARKEYQPDIDVENVGKVGAYLFGTAGILYLVYLVLEAFNKSILGGIATLIGVALISIIYFWMSVGIGWLVGAILTPFIWLFTKIFGSQQAGLSVGRNAKDDLQLEQALKQVDDYYITKEVEEITNEKIRIMLLNDTQFESEFCSNIKYL